MFEEKKKWMAYTYFNRHPKFHWRKTHFYSFINVKSFGNICTPYSTMIVDITPENFVSTWSGSTRTKINKAVREQLVVDRGINLLEDILKLFSITADKKGLRGYKVSDFDLFPKIECSAVIYEGVMLCGHVWLIDEEEKRALFHVNATNQRNDAEDTSLTGRAHYFLLWQDGLYLRSKGVDTLDLQGYKTFTDDPKLKGVYAWKAGTHGKQETLYHYLPFWFHLLRKIRNMATR